MKIFRKLIAIASLMFLSFLISACALTPEKIQIEKVISNQPQENIGKGTTVGVKIIDTRVHKDVGGRASGYGPAAKITIGNELTQIVEHSVMSALHSYGFKPVHYTGEQPVNLTVKIVNLDYRQSLQLFTAGISISSTLEARAKNHGREYEQTYSGSKEFDTVFTPTNSTDTKNINIAFSEAIHKMIADKALMEFMAK